MTTTRQKAKFISELIASVEKRLKQQVKRVPKEWDGNELRQWIADAFVANAVPFKGKRRKAYNNDVAINGLY